MPWPAPEIPDLGSASDEPEPGVYKAILIPDIRLRSGVTYTATVTNAALDAPGNPLDQNASLPGNQSKTWKLTIR